jgi:hypothetical protein
LSPPPFELSRCSTVLRLRTQVLGGDLGVVGPGLHVSEVERDQGMRLPHRDLGRRIQAGLGQRLLQLLNLVR